MAILQNYPNMRPSLLMDFANSGQVDPRMTFSRNTTATRWGPSGKLETVAANLPRIDYDPATGACLGLLMEEARTNLRTNSRQPIASTGTVLGTQTAMAPDKLAVLPIEDDPSASGEHYANDLSMAFIAGQVVTQSIYVKALPGADRQAALRFAGGAAGGQSLVFNVSDSACSPVSVPPYPYGVQKCPDGWWRIWSSFNPVADMPTGVVRIQMHKNNSTIYQGEAGKGLYLFGRQVELGAFPTSYIPTAAAAVTRVSDIATIVEQMLLPWYRQDEGTIVVEFVSNAVGVNSGAFSLDSGLQNSRMQIRNTGSGNASDQFVVETAAGIGVNMIVANGSHLLGEIKRTAFAYKQNDFAGCTAGGGVATDNLGEVPAVNIARIGDALGASKMTGYIRRIAYYPTRLPNEQLQRLTA